MNLSTNVVFPAVFIAADDDDAIVGILGIVHWRDTLFLFAERT